MKTIKIDLNNFKNQEIDPIVDFLKMGKVIVYPTDTIYGLGCLVTDKKAIEKIYKIKNREKRKPFLVLVSGWKMLEKYFSVSTEQKKYLRSFWPGKVSAILPHKGLFASNISEGFSCLAVRLPKSRILTKIIRAVDAPMVSTSLNLSKQPHLEDVSHLDVYFSGIKPDLVVDAGILKGKPSRLVDLSDMNNIKILRK